MGVDMVTNDSMVVFKELSSISSDVKVTHERLDSYNALLAQHIKRCDLLEDAVKEIRRAQYMIYGGMTVISVISPLLIKLVIH
jgi:hypothetical protein